MGSELDLDTPFDLVPTYIKNDVEQELNSDGKWRNVAVCFFTCTQAGRPGKCNFEQEVESLSRKRSPGKALLDLFTRSNLNVEYVQRIFWLCDIKETLNILVTNTVVSFEHPRDNIYEEIKLGESCSCLKVEAFGSPLPNLQWYHNGTPLANKTSDMLHIQSFKRGDAGLYVCRATQTINGETKEYMSSSFMLKIAKSSPCKIIDLKNISLQTGNLLMLVFRAEGEPEPYYVWYKDGREITRDNVGLFKVENVGMINGGNYSCIAVNSEGSCSSEQVVVKVSAPIRAPVKPEIILKPSLAPSYALYSAVDFMFKVRCRDPVKFTCTINDEDIEDMEANRPTWSEKKVDSSDYLFSMRYNVSDEDWRRGNKGPIIIRIMAQNENEEHYWVIHEEIINVVFQADVKHLTARNKIALLIANDNYETDKLATPFKDIQALAKVLTGMQFHCMLIRNVTQSDIYGIVELFCSFIRRGTYVFFYYAGHGEHHNDVEYMVPLPERTKSNATKWTTLGDFVARNDIINRIQKENPALLYEMYDSCRRNTTHAEPYPRRKIDHIVSKHNSVTLFATPKGYAAFEVAEGLSLLMSEFLKVAAEPRPVVHMSNDVLKAFNHNLETVVAPMFSSDLTEDRCLTDSVEPHPRDMESVLDRWERLSNVGGTQVKEHFEIDGEFYTISLTCEQEGYPYIISNWINIIIGITPEELQEATALESPPKQGLMVSIDLSTCKDMIEQHVTRNPIRCKVENIQKIRGDFTMMMYFSKNGENITDCKFSLGRPSLCDFWKSQLFNLNTL
ncbi:hypothetical protein SK128_001975 [Halocaridina rubra]|uniref:Ig-like domain-containing protein n=1 Tax=Halocaridina rubra TaxID=373956 RepID=A0AAN8XI55_HALRR